MDSIYDAGMVGKGGFRIVNRLCHMAAVELKNENDRRSVLKMVNWREYIIVDPLVCHGQACIKGTRVMVSVILDNLAAGLTEAEIIASYPTVSSKAIQAVMAYAAELAREWVVAVPA